ncbi:MAG TPA: MIP/aquaporin family protein [Verrucomicrobiae bacterium]|nr:MIP/aquaporin family protein [Verrucomicrobiae bacterium]
MSTFTAEWIGTAILVLLGDGVVANVLLSKSKGNNSGWIVIATGWGLAVALAVYCVGTFSQAHLNPAVTIGLASIGKFPLANVPGYLAAQMLGAMTGAILVWLVYLPHWRATADPAAKLGVFCTGPAVRSPVSNLVTEIIATFVLVVGIQAALGSNNLQAEHGFNTGFGPVVVGLIVFAIGISLGGPTGYAINPARDLGPRLVHAFLPIPGKGSSDFAYAWIPVVGPVMGGVLGAYFHSAFWPA